MLGHTRRLANHAKNKDKGKLSYSNLEIIISLHLLRILAPVVVSAEKSSDVRVFDEDTLLTEI